MKKNKTIERICFVLNLVIIVFCAIGFIYMVYSDNGDAALTTRGFSNFKYFTVLSNVLCGLIAIDSLLGTIVHKPIHPIWKCIAATEVAVTLIIVGFFLRPLYPNLNMYERGNLYYHLLLPLIAILEMVLIGINSEKMPFKWSLAPAAATGIYGIVYLMNNIINGIGEWPNTNDFYGFLIWGYPVGLIIFGVIILITWVIALILRIPNVMSQRDRSIDAVET